jgi:deoxycytidylate deaminase
MGKYGKIALKKALENDVQRHRVGCAVVKGGKILSVEHNLYTKHAEERATNKVWRSELVGATVYVARPMYNEEVPIGLAKPCSDCEKLLRSLGIKKVVYSNNGGWDFERY